MLHTDALLFYVLLFALINFGLRTVHTVMPDVLGYATDIHVEALLADTNAERIKAGLSPLTMNAQLSDAAARKAQDMFAKNYWAHNSPSGSTPWDFISAAGYRYTVAGENLAKNFSTSGAVVSAWKASPTHWANIIKPSYKEIGFAIVNGKLNGEETTLVVQMFGTSTASIASRPLPTATPIVIGRAEATVAPTVTATPTLTGIAEQPAVPQVAAAEPTTASAEQPAFAGVTKTPAINIPTLTRDIVFVFAGVLMGVLLLDAWIVSRKKIVRIAGHNIAHFLFLSAIVVLASMAGRGVLL